MAMVTYFCYEKVRRTMYTAIVSYILKTPKEVFLGLLTNLKHNITLLPFPGKICFVLFKVVSTKVWLLAL